MAVRQIRVIGDEILTKKCKPVKEMTPRMKERTSRKEWACICEIR